MELAFSNLRVARPSQVTNQYADANRSVLFLDTIDCSHVFRVCVVTLDLKHRGLRVQRSLQHVFHIEPEPRARKSEDNERVNSGDGTQPNCALVYDKHHDCHNYMTESTSCSTSSSAASKRYKVDAGLPLPLQADRIRADFDTFRVVLFDACQ